MVKRITYHMSQSAPTEITVDPADLIEDESSETGGGFWVLMVYGFWPKSFMVYGFGKKFLWFMVFQKSLKFYGLWFLIVEML